MINLIHQLGAVIMIMVYKEDSLMENGTQAA